MFLVDRPVKGKVILYAPHGYELHASVLKAKIREVIGGRSKISVEGWSSDPFAHHTHLRAEFARVYTQAVITWLRSLPECDYVRFRLQYILRDDDNPHCTPQCEGAWALEETKGIPHEDSCQCSCGGLKHNTGNPFWKRFEQESVSQSVDYRTTHDGREVMVKPTYDIRKLPPISYDNTSRIRLVSL